MTFASEARQAGITPILIVLDENPSALLTKLKEQYLNNGGKCYIGQEAWKMLSERAGKEMSVFINKYIYPPIHAMEELLKSNLIDISLSNSDGKITIAGNGTEYCIKREKK